MRAFLFFYKENKLIVLVFGNIRRFSIKIVKSLENHGWVMNRDIIFTTVVLCSSIFFSILEITGYGGKTHIISSDQFLEEQLTPHE